LKSFFHSAIFADFMLTPFSVPLAWKFFNTISWSASFRFLVCKFLIN
jgi:hypothetical protein